MINVTDFGALGTADDAPVFQAAFDHAKANNVALRAPAGEFRFGSTVNYVTSSASTLTPGLILEGDGAEKTVIINETSGPAFNIDTDTTLKFQRHGHIQGLSFHGGGSGLRLRRAHHFAVNDVQFTGQAEYGMHVPTLEGDGDACNHLQLDMVRFDNIGKWGFFGQAASGKNELSFLTMRNVTLESCGTTSTTVGGGMYWRGQCVSFDNVAFVLNKNRGLYIEGGAGLGSEVYGKNLVFENNLEKHVQCYGVSGMVFDNLQMYSNDTYKAQYGIWINTNSAIARNVLVRTAKVRATAGNNPYTAFQAAGANGLQNVRAIDVAWDNFGYAGQTQRVGFTA